MRDVTAADIVDLALRAKPELIIHVGNLPATAEALRDLLAAPAPAGSLKPMGACAWPTVATRLRVCGAAESQG
jgi:hypothetical protein